MTNIIMNSLGGYAKDKFFLGGSRMGKNWKAQEFYNEYLSLKDEIRFARGKEKEILTERLKQVLEDLKLEGVDMTDLVLLSAGVYIEIFRK